MASDSLSDLTTDLRALPALMRVEELAAVLRVNPKTLYALIRRGEIPGVVRVGRVIRMNRDVVVRWLSEGQVRGSRKQS